MRIPNPLPAIGSRLSRFYAWTGFGEKKLIDYVQLIVLPFVLILGGQLVSQAVNASAREQAQEQAQEQRLQEYLDQISSFALDRELLETDVDASRRVVIREVARAQTLTALEGMDGARKRFVVTFLYELGLINGVDALISLRTSSLVDADLSGAELFAANLSGARLAEADLSRARLTFALLNSANLSNANLRGALLVDTRLNQADLRLANLSGVDASNASMFNADLRGADLTDANLAGANLRSADLRGADLSRANLTGADLTGALIGDDPGEEHMFTDLGDVTWTDTVCPDRTVTSAQAEASCASHLVAVEASAEGGSTLASE
ncbi:MAG: pentapeptide repeat-containing protein [Dehalococcoidia bacterium]|nr:pentapeptide repeat-containing protein [Dehalococcoidia bacterium]